MENLNHVVLGITSLFKQPYTIRAVDKYTIIKAFESLGHKLPGFFSKVVFGQPSKVDIYDLPILGKPRYSERYLLVLSKLSEVLGLNCLCKLILEDGQIMPKQKIYVIGPQAEVAIFITASRYLYQMTKGVITATPKGTRAPKEHTAFKEQEISSAVYEGLKSLTRIRATHLPEDARKIRDTKMLDYIKFYVKLDYNKKENPIYTEKKISLKGARTVNGKFKNNKLL